MVSVFNGIYKLAGKLRSVMIDTDGNDLPDCEVHRIGQYGIYSKPLINSRAFCLKQGNKNYSIAENIAEVQPIENLLGEGDVAIDTGVVRMHFKHLTGEVEITGATSIKLGDNALLSLIDERIVQIFNTHTHPSAGGATGAPTTPIVKENVSTKILKGA